MKSIKNIIENYNSINKICESNNNFTYIISFNDIKKHIDFSNFPNSIDTNVINNIYTNYKSSNSVPLMIYLTQFKYETFLKCYKNLNECITLQKLNSYILDLKCIVNIIYNNNIDFKQLYSIHNDVNIGDINENDFINLNEDNNEILNDLLIKKDILDIVKKIETKYPNFVSTTSNCHSPNFNRDCIVDQLINIYIKLKENNPSLNIPFFQKLLYDLNDKYSSGLLCDFNKYKASKIDKCKKYNFWLFINKNINIEHLQFILNENLTNSHIDV